MSVNRRQHVRVKGPFDGKRISVIDTPVQVYDLSEGGCFVNSMQEQPAGREVTLEIVLPHEGAVQVTGKTLSTRPGFGFAVQFTQLEPQARVKIRRQLAQLLAEGNRPA